MLTAQQVIQRRSLYRCCSADYLSAAREAYIHGDRKCGDENTRKMLYMQWAAGVMCRTPVQDGESGCLTIEFASLVASKADCCCDCNCLPAQPPFDSQCAVEVDYTVIDAVAQGSLPVSPDADDQYYIISGSEVGNIATWDGSQWVYTSIPLNSVVLSEQDNDWYTNTGNGPGLLFPPIDAELVAPINQYEIVSAQPQIAENSTRSITIEAYVNGAWVPMFSGLESVISTPTVFDFIDLNIESLRIVYTVGLCSYVAGATIEPPFGGCGLVTITTQNIEVCGEDEFSIEVDIQNPQLWPIGDIVATVDGVEQSGVQGVVGTQTIGPFPSYSTVGVVVENANDQECNFDAGDHNDSTLPIADLLVFQAVDASFESSALPNTRYLILSDTEDSGNSWATHVGQIVENTTFTVPAVGSIIVATDDPGPTGYYQVMSAGVVVPVFPPLILEYREPVANWFYYIESPVATEVATTSASAYYDCGSGMSLLATQDAADFATPTVFVPECGIEVLQGEITYSYGGCEYTIPAIVREYNPGGEPDPDFSSGGLNNFVADLRIDANGKILVGGAFTAYGVTMANRHTRLNADGTLDTAYNIALGTGFDSFVISVEYDDQDRTLLGGFFSTFNGSPAGHIIRLNADGSVDNTFATGVGFNGTYVQDMAIDPLDGTILVGGLFTTYQGVTRNRIVALNPDGTVNTSWAFGTGLNNYAQEIVLGDDGNAYVAGPFTVYNGTNLGAGPHLIRILPDGTLDTGFLAYNLQFNDDIQDIAYLPDGRIMVVGEFTLFNGVPSPRILMLNNDGTIDTAFMTNIGVGFGQTFQDIRLLANGQIMLGGVAPGQIGSAANKLIRLNADGTRDLTFDIGTGPNGDIYDVALDTDGTLVIGGTFTIYDGVGRLRVARVI